MTRAKTQNVVDDSITFSLRAHPGDTIARRYTNAKLLGVAVTSPFRQDLQLYDILLSNEEDSMTSREKKSFTEIVRTLALSHQIRAEGVPVREDIVRYLRLAGKDTLVPMISNSTNVRLFLIIDRAKEHAARIELARTPNGGANGHSSGNGDAHVTPPTPRKDRVPDLMEIDDTSGEGEDAHDA